MASQVQIPFEGAILQEHSAPISCPTPNFAKGSLEYSARSGGRITARGQTGVSQRVQVGILRSRPPDTPHCAAGTASPRSAGIPPASCAFGRGCARLCAGGTPALPGSHHPMTGHEFAEAFWRRLSLKEVHLYSCVFVFIRGSSSLMIGRFSWNDPHGRAGARPNRYQGGSRRSRTARLRQRGIQTIPGSAAGRSVQ